MTITTQHSFSSNEDVTAMYSDTNSNHLWTAFAQNSSDYCILKKQGCLDPEQTYYSLNKYVDEIVAIAGDATYIYLAYSDTTLLGEIISASNPLTTTVEITNPESEDPVDVLISGSDLWYLLPGSASGANAKLLKYNTSGVLQTTVDLTKSGTTITNAKSMTVDGNGDIWIATYAVPSTIVRVTELSGGTYEFTEDTSLIT